MEHFKQTNQEETKVCRWGKQRLYWQICSEMLWRGAPTFPVAIKFSILTGLYPPLFSRLNNDGVECMCLGHDRAITSVPGAAGRAGRGELHEAQTALALS